MNWGAALAALLAGVLINEVSDISPWIGQRLVRWAARLRYGQGGRARVRAEEWSALLNERPGKLLKLASGLLFFLDALPRAVGRLVRHKTASEEMPLDVRDLPHQSLVPRQRTALLTLMSVGKSSVTSAEIREGYGVDLRRDDREMLNALGLVDSRREGRTVVYELTEKGWAWCAQEVGARREPSGGLRGGGVSAEAALLVGLSRFMDRNGLTLAEVFGEDAGSVGRASSMEGRGRRWRGWRVLRRILSRR